MCVFKEKLVLPEARLCLVDSNQISLAGVSAHKKWGCAAAEPPAHPPQTFHPGSQGQDPAWGEGAEAPLRQLQGLQRRL